MDNSKILIVDDQMIGRQLLESILFKEDYELLFAENGQEALDMIYEHEPDVVLLDVMMPQIDGFEVCKRVRGDDKIKDTPIILVTALDDRDSRLNGFQAGANDYVSKPIDRLELLARVKNLTQMFQYKKKSSGSTDQKEVTKIVESPQDFLAQINTFISKNEDEDLKIFFPDFFEFIHQSEKNTFSASFTHELLGSIHLLYLQCSNEQLCNELSILLNSLFPRAVHSQTEEGLKQTFKKLIENLDKYFYERYQEKKMENVSMVWVDINRNYHQFQSISKNIETFMFCNNEKDYFIKEIGKAGFNLFNGSDRVLFMPSKVKSNIEVDQLKESNFSDMDSFIDFLTDKGEEITIAGFTIG